MIVLTKEAQLRLWGDWMLFFPRSPLFFSTPCLPMVMRGEGGLSSPQVTRDKPEKQDVSIKQQTRLPPKEVQWKLPNWVIDLA